MTDVFPLSLRASPKLDPDKESLPYLISRINDQRGSFRNITEEGLEEEIGGGDNAQLDSLGEAEGEDNVPEVKSRQEELAEARQQMITQVQQAHWECIGGLSLISLVLAGHNQQASARQQAINTIDPYIREALSKDALGIGKLQEPQKPETERTNERVAELGWKTQSLQSVADSLLNSATRLEKELGSETRYWDQVLKIKDQGWSVTRLPREKHALGVRYGFAEAYADFRDRGMAALRRDEDGNISLDRGLRFTGDRKLRVRIFQNRTMLGCNRLSRPTARDPEVAVTDADDDEDENDSIEDQILQARDSLFDEELHAELHREAQNLMNQGVICIGDIIQLPFRADQSIHIDLINIDDIEMEPFHIDDQVATAISVALRLLLSYSHRQNLRRRSRPPLPLKDGKVSRPVYQILKPVIEHIQYNTNVKSCENLIFGFQQTLQAAGLDLGVETDKPALVAVPDDTWVIPKDGTSTTERPIRSLISPPHSTFTLSLPSKHALLKIEVLTNLFPPNFGTTYQGMIQSSKPDGVASKIPISVLSTSLSEVEFHIRHVLTVDLVDCISAGWSVVDPHTGMLTRIFENGDGETGSLSIRVVIEAKKLTLESVRQSDDEEVAGDEQKRFRQSVVWSEGIGNGNSLLGAVQDLAALAS